MTLYKNIVQSPLAERMRPKNLDEFLGQDELTSADSPFRKMLEKGSVHSMILWGPPGVGKTSLGYIIAKMIKAEFVPFSAVVASIKEVKKVIAEAKKSREGAGRKTILFIDEIHRFNRAQQDAFLPSVERGDIVLIGATTENPSFEVVSPLLSRCKVYLLKPLPREALATIIRRALAQDDIFKKKNLQVDRDAEEFLAMYSGGDARMALNLLEAGAEGLSADSAVITTEHLQKVAQSKTFLYDKSGEEHFNLISALHKSVRNSDPDAGLYWLARMLEAGEDSLYIARRLVRAASEDIGLADPRALTIALSAKDAVDFIGIPEGNLALAEAVIYLALAPKSNAVYRAYGAARKDVREKSCEPVPLHLRNPVTSLMKNFDYGKNYEYAHNLKDGVAQMECFPQNLVGRVYYEPSERGLESALRKRLEEIRGIKRKNK